MQLAVNYSHQAADLIANAEVDIDLFKCPDWPDMVAEARQKRPVYVHFPLFSGGLDDVDWTSIEGFLATTPTRFVNLHLAPHLRNFPGMDLHSDDPADLERIVAMNVRSVEVMQQRFGKEHVIVENVPWDPRPQFAIPRAALHPEAVRRTVEATGCGLLLDTAHARIAALKLDIEPVAYLDALPLDRLAEMHVTGVAYEDEAGRWVDHYPMTDADWPLVEHVLAGMKAGRAAQPQIVTLEYGAVGPNIRNSERTVLARELPRLRALVAGVLQSA